MIDRYIAIDVEYETEQLAVKAHNWIVKQVDCYWFHLLASQSRTVANVRTHAHQHTHTHRDGRSHATARISSPYHYCIIIMVTNESEAKFSSESGLLAGNCDCIGARARISPYHRLDCVSVWWLEHFIASMYIVSAI